MSIRAATNRIVDFPKVRPTGLQIGDTVRTGENRFPQYVIVAISGERAWIRAAQYGTDYVVPLAILSAAAS